jgi:carboxypeptidase C (cathepsin A)
MLTTTNFVIAAVLCASTNAKMQYSSEALKTEIHDLPGKPKSPEFRQFSGYMSVNHAGDERMFYWFVEAQDKPETKPLVLWTNGGPGCSGLSGFLTEHGPYRADAKGSLELNPYAWNTLANIVYIESPAGVGFSETPNGTIYGDHATAVQNANFIDGFLEMYADYKEHDLYLTSESYGGHYMPTLATELVRRGLPTFKGFAVGNPLTNMPFRDYGQYGTWADHQLIPAPMLDDYLAKGCRKDDSSAACQAVLESMDGLTGDLNPYALDFPLCQNGGALTTKDTPFRLGQREALMASLRRVHPQRKLLGGYFPKNYDMCADNQASAYLNRADVKRAIHANHNTQWAECAMAINQGWNQTDILRPMMPLYQSLVASSKKLNILVYSGDDDSVCATLGSQQWIWGLGLKEIQPWAPWYTAAHQVGGYHVEFEGFQFTTVHGAGHMVPQTRPQQALTVFQHFLNGKW